MYLSFSGYLWHREGLRYALEKMDSKTKQMLSDEHLKFVPGGKKSGSTPSSKRSKKDGDDDEDDDEEDGNDVEEEIPTPKQRGKSKRTDQGESSDAPKAKRANKKSQ
jgi:hypothetical protein